jgi:hypothetical protein
MDGMTNGVIDNTRKKDVTGEGL